jgi:hypothetical protein
MNKCTEGEGGEYMGRRRLTRRGGEVKMQSTDDERCWRV